MGDISEKVHRLLTEVPKNIIVLAAVKGRTIEEIKEAIEAGIQVVGENYLQEAEEVFPILAKEVEWHFIGHIQRRKAKKIVEIFDIVESIDSLETASEIDKYCSIFGKKMPILIEVNSNRETQKSGITPDDVEQVLWQISALHNIKIVGIMTMGPLVDDPEKIRPYFRLVKEIYEKLKKLDFNNVEMKFLSMGMSDSYKVAIEEGANIVRIGSLIFGPRSR